VEQTRVAMFLLDSIAERMIVCTCRPSHQEVRNILDGMLDNMLADILVGMVVVPLLLRVEVEVGVAGAVALEATVVQVEREEVELVDRISLRIV